MTVQRNGNAQEQGYGPDGPGAEAERGGISRRKLLRLTAYSVPAMTLMNMAGTARALTLSPLPGHGDQFLLPGFDSFRVEEAAFTVPTIPPDFFDPGSDPFGNLVGNLELNCGGGDTVIQRLGPAVLPSPWPSTDTVPIEMVQLSLVSCQPIIVTFEGGSHPQQWNVQVDLSPSEVPPGTMTITKTHVNGGTFEATLPVQPRFTFTRVGDEAVRVLDTGDLVPFLEFHVETTPWSICPGGGSNFCPGWDHGVEGDVGFVDLHDLATFSAHFVCP